METKQCRWGFLSTADIGKKNWHAIELAENAKLTAVASRNSSQAKAFIDACQGQVPLDHVPDPVEGYAELLTREDVDAVYIPLPTGMRKEWVIRAAEAGKHVLCEKPCAIQADDLQEMIDACATHDVQFMDGVMLMHTQRLKMMRSIVDDQIGEVRRVHSHLTFRGDQAFRDENIRTDSQLEPHGCLGDLGWYNIRIALWAMNWEMPKCVRGRCLSQLKRDGSQDFVPMSFSGELEFHNASAGFYCSFEDHHQQWAVLGGSKGDLRIKDFVLPFANQDLEFELNQADFVVENCQFDMFENKTIKQSSESANNAPDSPESKLFKTFSELVVSGKTDPFWPSVALKTQIVLDACFQSAKNDSATIDLN